MPDLRRISARHYYDYLPPQTHACGDIWSNLTTLNLLGSSPVSGIVVTPACDLSQNKTETVTYLPVVPIRAYFSTVGALRTTRERVIGHLKAAHLTTQLEWDSDEFHPPTPHDLKRTDTMIKEHLAIKQRGATETASLSRALAGLEVIAKIAEPDLVEI